MSRFLVLLLTFCLVNMSNLFAHPGGTDKDGCHIEKKTSKKHCHEKGKSKKKSQHGNKSIINKISDITTNKKTPKN